MLRIKYNYEQDITMEELINSEYEIYVLEKDGNLNTGAIELKNAWKIVIERMKLYDVLTEIGDE